MPDQSPEGSRLRNQKTGRAQQESFTLRALSIGDLERDFNAILESAADIKAAHPGSNWPDGLTKEQDLVDLAWHQREVEARRSFA